MEVAARFLRILSLLVLCQGSVTAQSLTQDAQQLSSRLGRAIGQIWEQTVRVETPNGHGSGTVVGADGLILTAHHVVNADGPVVCVLSDGRRLAASCVLVDTLLDVALLKVEAADLSFAKCSNRPSGSWVMASGFPFSSFSDGLPTVSMGRLLETEGRIVADGGRTFDHLQVMDAPIFRGSSGSGLFDESGQLIGVVLARSDTGNRGFAVSISALSARRSFALRLCLQRVPRNSRVDSSSSRSRDVWFRRYESRLLPGLNRGRVVLSRPDDGHRFCGLLVSDSGDILVPSSAISGLVPGAVLGRGVTLAQIDSGAGLALAVASGLGPTGVAGVQPIDLAAAGDAVQTIGTLVFAQSGQVLVGGMLNAVERSLINASLTKLRGCDIDVPDSAVGQMAVDAEGRFVGMFIGARLSAPTKSVDDRPIGAFILATERLTRVYARFKSRETVSIPRR